MLIEVSNTLTVENPTPEMVLWCKRNLTIPNPEYAKKSRMNLWLGNTPKVLSLYETRGTTLVLPFGTLRLLPKDISDDIAIGVDKAFELKKADNISNKIESIGAGDQGMMFGFATNETKEFMPYPIVLAHKLAQQLTKVRKDKILPYLRSDGKTQVTIEYDEEQKPIRIEAVVLSTQHDSVVTQKQIHTDIKKYVFDPILPIEMVDENTKYFINPTGRFVVEIGRAHV